MDNPVSNQHGIPRPHMCFTEIGLGVSTHPQEVGHMLFRTQGIYIFLILLFVN